MGIPRRPFNRRPKFLSTLTDNITNWVGQAQAYGQTYTNPIVFGQVMSHNDANWSVFWSLGSARTNPPTTSSLYTGKHVGQDSSQTRADELIGLIIIESGNGTIDNLEYRIAIGGDIVRGVTNSPPYN